MHVASPWMGPRLLSLWDCLMCFFSSYFLLQEGLSTGPCEDQSMWTQVMLTSSTRRSPDCGGSSARHLEGSLYPRIWDPCALLPLCSAPLPQVESHPELRGDPTWSGTFPFSPLSKFAYPGGYPFYWVIRLKNVLAFSEDLELGIPTT